MADHLFIDGWSEKHDYTSPGTGRNNVKTPFRSRTTHGTALRRKFEAAWTEARSRKVAVVSGSPEGMYVQFESDPLFPLDLDKLDLKSKGIALLAVDAENNNQRATVFIPEGQTQFFIQRIEEYINEDTRFKKAKNRQLMESIADLRLATLENFWTDDKSLFPNDDEDIWWEVWLRNDDGNEIVTFRRLAQEAEMVVGEKHLSFPDRTVILCYATASQLSKSILMLGYFAELRKAKELPNFYLELTPKEQYDWISNVLDRCTFSDDEAPAICILDTGVNRGHPLLEKSIAIADTHAFNSAWGPHDHHSHGTEMAGISLFGDLAAKLASSEPLELTHCLESVKILPPPPATNPPELYGVITADAAARTEIAAPSRKRVFLMAVTAPDRRDRGLPTSWSAEVDSLSSAANEQEGSQKLFVLSSGNRHFDDLSENPFDGSLTDSVHDPGQSWNALTVGAYTQRALITEAECSGWNPLANAGELSPTSTTSKTWDAQWPIKPEVVAEGGNYAIDPDGRVRYCDSLALLTTNRRFPTPYFSTTGDTSAAAANIANIAAIILARYPKVWPETLRAIIIHSARWNNQMMAQAKYAEDTGKNLAVLLRCFGYGSPDLSRALESTSNALTLIAQEKIFLLKRQIQGNDFS